MNVVGAEIHGHLIPVAVEGCLLIAPDELGVAVFIGPLFTHKVDDGGVIGAVDKGVIVRIVKGVVCKVEVHGIAVFSLKRDHIALMLDAQTVVLITVVGIDKNHELSPVVELHIRQVISAVHEVERYLLVQLLLGGGARVSGIASRNDAVLAVGLGISGDRAGEPQRQRQQHCQGAG